MLRAGRDQLRCAGELGARGRLGTHRSERLGERPVGPAADRRILPVAEEADRLVRPVDALRRIALARRDGRLLDQRMGEVWTSGATGSRSATSRGVSASAVFRQGESRLQEVPSGVKLSSVD
jgi:hypothetical protein